MKLYEMGLVILISSLIALAGIGYLSQKWLGDDNIIEEHVEEVIQDITGLDIDLSPNSPEEPKEKKLEILKF